MGHDLRDRTSRDQEIDVSTPGTGGPQPPEQDPSQSAQPTNPGQQPPAGQPWGAPQAGQPYPGQQPQQPWGAPQQPGMPAFGQPQEPGKPKRKWLPIVGGVVALLVVLGVLSTFLGGASAKAGDCVNDKPDEIGVVDCDSDEAAFTVAGVVEDVSQNQMNNDETVCEEWPNWVAFAWEGTNPDDLDSEGTGYCLEELTN
jgi:hypothetical protein